MRHVGGVITIHERRVGIGQPCFVMAEAGVNHNGRMELAHQLVDAAAAAGVDAVKFQTFTAERLVTPSAPLAAYQRRALGAGQAQYDLLRQLELSPQAHRDLRDHCHRKGLVFLSSPFDEDSVELLEALGVGAYKIPSGELTNLPFLAQVARRMKPLIVSTGMASLDEVAQAMRIFDETGNRQVVLLHCVSSYPALPNESNLRAMHTLADRFGVPVGYSDHTEGIEVALAAVALGACVIEKHLTLDRRLAGPDHAASVEPHELASLVRGIRIVEAALGHGRKEPTVREAEVAAAARKSLVAAQDIPAGAQLTEQLIVAKRPGTGLPPSMRAQLVGKIAKQDIPAQTLLNLDMVR